MGGAQAAAVLAQVKRDAIESEGGQWTGEEEAAFKEQIRGRLVSERLDHVRLHDTR